MSAIIISEDVPNIDKFVATNRVYAFDFSKFSELSSDTLGTPTTNAPIATPDSALVVGTPAVTLVAIDGIPAGKGVGVRISVGTRGKSYEVEVRCPLVDDPTTVLVRRVIFNVK